MADIDTDTGEQSRDRLQSEFGQVGKNSKAGASSFRKGT